MKLSQLTYGGNKPDKRPILSNSPDTGFASITPPNNSVWPGTAYTLGYQAVIRRGVCGGFQFHAVPGNTAGLSLYRDWLTRLSRLSSQVYGYNLVRGD